MNKYFTAMCTIIKKYGGTVDKFMGDAIMALFGAPVSYVKEIEYYESGQVKMEGGMKDGKMEGEWTSYFPDGRVQSHGFFENGERTGAAQVFYANGNKYEEGNYKNGKHCGKWKFYDEQGTLLKEVDFGEVE